MKGTITSAGRKPARFAATLTFFLSVLLFASCSKDEPVQPIVSENTEASNSARISDGTPEPLPGSVTSTKSLMPPDAMIYIKHGLCFGTCPAYSIILTADGHVIYTGYRNTGTIGSVKFSISQELANKLADDMIMNGFLKLENFYPSSSPDDAMNVTGIRVGVGNVNPKVVVDYGMQVPRVLTDLRTRIEMELGIDKLVSAETAPLDLPSTIKSGQ